MIYVSSGFDFGYGGELAAPWSNCSANNDVMVATFQSQFKPIVQAFYDATRNRLTFLDKHPTSANFPLGTFVVGDVEYKINTISGNESSRTKRSMKQFEKARKAGDIVLSPMRAISFEASATPQIFGTVIPNIEVRRNYVKLGIVDGISGGVCRSNWRPCSAAEADIFGNDYREKYTRYDNTQTIEVPEFIIHKVIKDLVRALDGITPNGALVTNVVSEANSATFDLATELGELPETIKMIINAVRAGLDLVIKARREMRKSISSGSVLKDASSVWMAYRYGIMPIMYSISDAVDLLEAESRVFQTFRGRQDGTIKIDSNGYTGEVSYQQRVFLKQKYALESSLMQGIKFDPLSTAWELIPLSFVFDWFIQVGDYLTALGTPAAVSKRGATDSVKCESNITLDGPNDSKINVALKYYRAAPIQTSEFLTLNSDLFVSFKRSMDAIALSWLLFKKDKRR